jgi:hypothetical protein
MRTTQDKNVKNELGQVSVHLSCPSLSFAVPTMTFQGSNSTLYNKGIRAIHLSSPLIVVINFYI